MEERRPTKRYSRSFWKRKIYTDPKFQGNFILFMVLTSLFIIGVLYAANLIWLWRFIVSLVAVILSHKIAGPLFRLRNHIIYNSKIAKESNLRFIHFRKKDNFKTLGIAYNEQVKLIKRLKRELEDTKSKNEKPILEIKKVS